MNTIFDFIRTELFKAADEEYLKFQGSLIPDGKDRKMIGVRTPELRALAKELLKRDDKNDFLSSLPHEYFEENQLHAFMISEMKNYQECIAAIEVFLPYVDNWATCDQMTPKSFKKNRQDLSKRIDSWIASDHVYTRRFGVKTAMVEFLDDGFDPSFPEKIAKIKVDDYYIMMVVAWYFATALAKQYDTAIKYLEDKKLAPEVHKKTIQKACESFRITDAQKAYLRTLKL